MITWQGHPDRASIGAWIARLAVAAAMAAACAQPVRAQDHPFVFSMTMAPDAEAPRARVDYDVGIGEQTFPGNAANGPEQRVGIQASIGRWTFVGRVGASTLQGTYASSQQGEVLYTVSPTSSGLGVAIGGGMLREPGGADVWLARLVAGHDAGRWRLHGNVLMQMPRGIAGRDAVDVITTVGWARRLSRSVSLGVEGIGEDLEGFADPAETEGGARLLVGPSLHIAPAGRRWQLSVAGGPMFHPAGTRNASGALRDLPGATAATTYAVRTSFACSF